MIGSPELNVDGITAAGEHVPVLRNGEWQLLTYPQIRDPLARIPIRRCPQFGIC